MAYVSFEIKIDTPWRWRKFAKISPTHLMIMLLWLLV